MAPTIEDVKAKVIEFTSSVYASLWAEVPPAVSSAKHTSPKSSASLRVCECSAITAMCCEHPPWKQPAAPSYGAHAASFPNSTYEASMLTACYC